MKKIISFIFVFCVTMCLAQEVTITKVQQRYPWNGLVDIEFEVPSATIINLYAVNLTTSMEIEMKTLLDSTGKTIEQPFQVSAGTHTITWNTDVDAPNTIENEIKIYANEGKYLVRFNANGGKGTMPNQSFTHGIEQSLSLNTFTLDGNIFVGWATSSDGAVVYTDGAIVKNLSSEADGIVNLFAIWQETHNGVQLWENGPYWAETNIGAENPEDYGYYFWWGDTIGYKRENDKWVASDGSSSNFEFSASLPTTRKSNAKLKEEGWINPIHVLASVHDAARTHWGVDWRMPTRYEFLQLLEYCTWTWTTKNGVKGYKISGKGTYSEASIFLPATGYVYCLDGQSIGYSGNRGYYWSSSAYEGNYVAYALYFGTKVNFGTQKIVIGDYTDCNRCNGMPIRPVSYSTK